MPAIDIGILREMRAGNAEMVRYYRDAEKKVKQNEALIAAGLEPLHKPSSLQWDIDHSRQYQRFVDTLDALIAHFGADQAEAA